MMSLWIPFISVYCLIVGWETSKTQRANILLFLIFPILFAFLSLCLLLNKSGLCLFCYTIAFLLSYWLGWLAGKKLDIKINRAKYEITVPGSWHLMLCLLGIFGIKIVHSLIEEVMPKLLGQYSHIEWFFTGLLSGFLVGRSMNFLFRFLKAK